MNDTPELFAATVHGGNRVDKPPGKIGGCVGTFLQLFDWNPRKRLFSTKRLPAERPNGGRKAASSSKKRYKDERMPVAKLLLLAEEENRGGFPSPKKISSVSSGDRLNSEDGMTGKRVPGVVARLMGLESLPDERGAEGKISPQHKNLASVEVRPLQELLHARQEPVLLSDLLREREYLEAKKLSLKDRLHVPVPGFVKNPEPVPQMSSYVPPKDGFKKPLRNEVPHLQPYADQKYHKSLRPLKKTSRDLADTKHLILALSPRASSDSLRPILLPSKVHNKLMSSPIKSPTKMGSRSARLLEAAVKILEPSLQSSTTRTRGASPPVRPSSVSARDFRDLESEVAAGMAEERREREREKTVVMDRKAAVPSNAARSLKGQSMSRSWNGREETGKFSHDYKSSNHDAGRGRRNVDQHAHGSQSRTASPMRTSQRSRNRNVVPQEDMNARVMEEIKTVVPQGFEEAYGGGLKPLNVGRREEVRLDKYEVEDRRVTEKHVVSSLASVNSPYSECSERSTTSSYHDPLRRSGSVKEGPVPSTPATSKTRFMRSKSVKEEKSSKLSSGGAQSSHHHHSRTSNRDVRVKQEIPQQAHQSHQAHHTTQGQQSQLHYQSYHHPPQGGSLPSPETPVVEEPPPQRIEALIAQRDPFQPESDSASVKSTQTSVTDAVRATEPEVVILQQQLPKPVQQVAAEVDVSADESVSSRSSQMSSVSQLSGISLSKEGSVVSRASSGGGMLYNRLFGSRRGGEKKSSEGKEKSKSRSDAPKRSESSLVRSLLRRKSSSHSSSSLASSSVSPPAPVKSMEKPKKRGAKNVSLSEPPSRVMSDAETLGYLSEDCSMDIDCDVEAAVQAHKERVFHRESDMSKQSPSKSINDLFPEVPLDKGCLRLLDEVDESGSQRIPIEGFDCVEDDDPQDRIRGEIMSYAAHLIDDLKLEEMFSTGAGFQGSGRHGFSYSPLVELEEPPRSSLETFILDGGEEVEKCVSFLGRTRSLASSPEMSFIKREVRAEDPDNESCKSEKQLLRTPANDLASEDPKAAILNELAEARKIVDDALEEATERVSKKFAAKGRVVLDDVDDGSEAVCASAVGNDDCGQPSPVSVLDCLFEEDETRSPEGNVHDSLCEMEVEDFDEDDDEDSLMDDLLFESAAALMPRKQRKQRKKLPTLTIVTVADSDANVKTDNEKIVDAILDMSRLRSPDSSTTCGLVLESADEFREEEEDYVRKILSVFEVFPETSGNGAGAELPIASTLFDRLESQGRASAWKREKEREQFGTPSPEVGGAPTRYRSFKQWQGLWLHRRLLFDCVNETMAYRLKSKYPDPWMCIPILRDPPKGRVLASDVYTEITNWRDVQTEELDTIIELDMTRGFGNWTNLTQEIAEIGLEIERTLLRVMIEEVVTEIMGVAHLAKFCSVRG